MKQISPYVPTAFMLLVDVSLLVLIGQEITYHYSMYGLSFTVERFRAHLVVLLVVALVTVALAWLARWSKQEFR